MATEMAKEATKPMLSYEWMHGWLDDCTRFSIGANVYAVSPRMTDGEQTCFVTDGKAGILAVIPDAPQDVEMMPEAMHEKYVKSILLGKIAPEPSLTCDMNELRAWCGPAVLAEIMTCSECKGTCRMACPECGEGKVRCELCRNGKVEKEPESRPGKLAGVVINRNYLARLLEPLPAGSVTVWLYDRKQNPDEWWGLSLAGGSDQTGWRVWLMRLDEHNCAVEFRAGNPVPAGDQEQPQPAEHCRAICPDCGPVEVEPFGYDNGVPVAGECPKCRENIYFG